MLAENQKLEAPSIKDIVPYSKVNKLVTALYMVTDIMDKDEPLRNKLRTLGVEILSDIHTSKASSDINKKVEQIVSFLDIALTIGMVSEMNSSILKKEFIVLNRALDQSQQGFSLMNFLKESPKEFSKGQGGQSLKLGVQKGSTLMKALSDKTNTMSNNQPNQSENFERIKKQRREDIIKIIKDTVKLYPALGGATIKDIKDSNFGSLTSCGEKTLQRELVSMVRDNILSKTGEKRWSRYSIVV